MLFERLCWHLQVDTVFERLFARLHWAHKNNVRQGDATDRHVHPLLSSWPHRRLDSFVFTKLFTTQQITSERWYAWRTKPIHVFGLYACFAASCWSVLFGAFESSPESDVESDTVDKSASATGLQHDIDSIGQVGDTNGPKHQRLTGFVDTNAVTYRPTDLECSVLSKSGPVLNAPLIYSIWAWKRVANLKNKNLPG